MRKEALEAVAVGGGVGLEQCGIGQALRAAAARRIGRAAVSA
ncbi:hypothetical protein ACFVFI_32240 [Streptomyces sp. NPDC057705]